MAETANSPGTPETLSKMEAVRRALTALGKKAMPAQMQPWIKEKLGIDMSTDHISVCKGKILKKAKGKKGKSKVAAPAAGEPKAVPTAPTQPAPASRAAATLAAGAVSLQDVVTLKALVERVGANNLRSLIDLLAK